MLSWQAEYTSTSIVIGPFAYFLLPQSTVFRHVVSKKKWVGLKKMLIDPSSQHTTKIVLMIFSNSSSFDWQCLINSSTISVARWWPLVRRHRLRHVHQLPSLPSLPSSPRPSTAIIGWGSLEVHFSTCKDCRRELLVKSLMMSISNARRQEFQFCSSHLHFSTCKDCHR